MPVSYRGALARRHALGAIVLVALVGVAALLWQRPDPFSSRQVITAEISDADGLAAIGADVRVAGVPVGSVTGVARRGDHAQLTLSLDRDVGVVHRDATISLRPRLMFEGTAYVALWLGSPGAPALGEEPIGLAHSSTYVPFDQAIGFLDRRGRGDVRLVVGALSRLPPAALRSTLAAAPRLETDAAVDAQAAQGPSGTELRSAVHAVARDAATIAAQTPAVDAALRDEPGVAAAADGGGALDQTLRELPDTVRSVSEGATAADAIVSRLEPLIGSLQPAARQLEPTLAAVRPLLHQATPTLGALTPTLTKLQTVVDGARSGAEPADGALEALAPTLNVFQNTLLGALERPTDLGDPAYLAFLGLFAGGGGASSPFGVDGQGHFMRFGLRFLTGAGEPLPPCTLLDKLSSTLGGLVSNYGGCTP